jgi:hypothetical protein
MANPEHLEILKLGIRKWNKWAKELRDGCPDLSNANLTGAKLNGAKLNGANLAGADLSGTHLHEAGLVEAILDGANLSAADLRAADLRLADLHGANLSRADLRQANFVRGDLRYADLTNANFIGADLSATDLREAKLNGADLQDVNFSNANLSGADFSQAKAFGTLFVDVDLSAVKWLDTVVHRGPSTVGIDSIYKSGGKIPDVFLRGCGLQDWEIEVVKLYRQDLTAAGLTKLLAGISEWLSRAPVHYHSCFISHSTKDQEFADRLYADLQNEGVRCLFCAARHQGRAQDS